MNGKLIVIDGLDATGKQTQIEMMRKSLIDIYNKEEDKDFCIIDFPRYGKESCKAVESYLNGKFSDDPMKIDSYTASMMYAIDRSISFKTEKWGEIYRNGGLVVADRYTCSNIIHQGSKLKHIANLNCYSDIAHSYEFDVFINWLYRLEYSYCEIPRPDYIIYLRSSEEAENKLMEYRKANDKNHNTDIHEKNKDYLNLCRNVLDAYKEYVSISPIGQKIKHKFINIDYRLNNNFIIKTKEDIHKEILEATSDIINNI